MNKQVSLNPTTLLISILSLCIMLSLSSCVSDSDNTDEPSREKDLAGMKRIAAKDASFQMGQSRPDIGGPNYSVDEQPVHQVTFTRDFWMDSSEVTQGDYDALMKTAYSGYTTPVWNNTYGMGGNFPVYNIFWDDAVLYCNARSKGDGFDTVYSYTAINGTPGNGCGLEGVVIDLSKNGYRLPSEAEWEYACRAGSSTDYYWGKNHPYPAAAADTAELSSYAVWKVNSYDISSTSTGSNTHFYGTHTVASGKPNAYGLYDMAGNLYEFCNDWFGGYTADAQTDPAGPQSGNGRVVRGGSWGNEAFYLRATNRYFFAPDYEYYFIGFRVVKTAD